jgi:hypothetical protein
MSTDIRIIHAQDFIKATPEGQLDFEASKQLCAKVASISASSDIYRLIVDIRKAQVKMSVTDLWYLATELSKQGGNFSRRTAVLCPHDQFDQAGFFALCAQNIGHQVRAFTSFEEAIEWLIENWT